MKLKDNKPKKKTGLLALLVLMSLLMGFALGVMFQMNIDTLNIKGMLNDIDKGMIDMVFGEQRPMPKDLASIQDTIKAIKIEP